MGPVKVGNLGADTFQLQAALAGAPATALEELGEQ